LGSFAGYGQFVRFATKPPKKSRQPLVGAEFGNPTAGGNRGDRLVQIDAPQFLRLQMPAG